MKRIKIKTTLKRAQYEDVVKADNINTIPEIINTAIASRDLEIQMLKNDVEVLKKELYDFKLSFEYFKQQPPPAQAQPTVQPSKPAAQPAAQPGQTLCIYNFEEWVYGLEVTPTCLEKLFNSKEMYDWVCDFIADNLTVHAQAPICTIKGLKNELFVYENNIWEKLTNEDFSTKFIDKLFKKILRSFTNWKNENYKLIITNDKYGTIYHTNNMRILSFNENVSKLKLKLCLKLSSL